MSLDNLASADFDHYMTLSEKAERAQAIASNDAFILAMAMAVRKGREKAKPGTYVDNSPAIGARRIYAEPALSSCGSPGAMCMDSGGAHSGAETMK